MMKKILLIILLTAIQTPLHAAEKTGADFLNFPGSARAASLGATSAAMADDVDLMNANPAGIAALSSSAGKFGSLALSNQALFLNSNLTQINAAVPMGRTVGGLSISRLSYANIEGRSADRSVTGSIGASDMSVGAALARNIGGMQLGTQLKMIRQELGSESANGIALDLGLISRTPVSRLSVGGAVRNLGNKMQFVNDSYSLPLTLSVGGSYQVLPTFTIGAGLQNLPHQNKTVFSLGTEIQAASAVTFRGGYLGDGMDGVTGGIGLHMGRLNLDYAVQPFGALGTVHTFTLASRFDYLRPSTTPSSEEDEQPSNTLEPDNRLEIELADPSNPFGLR